MAGAAGIVAGAGMLAWPTESPDAAVLAEKDRLTAMFDEAGRQDAEQELRAVRSRTTVEQWDDLVLSYARQRVDGAPTQALAALKHLSTDGDHWLGAARVLAAGAVMRGPVAERLEGIEGARVLEFSSDASVLGIVDARGNASLWSVTGGYQALELSARAEGSLTVRDLAVGPGKEPTVWLAADDGAVWRWSDGVARKRVKLGSNELRSIALAPEASRQGHPRLAVSDSTGVVFVIDAAEDPIVRELRDHRTSVGALAFGPEGIKLASGSDDGAIRLWFLDRQTHRSLEAAGAVSRLRFTEDGQAIAAQTADGTLQQWTTEGVRMSRTLDTSLAWDTDLSGRRQVRFDEDGLRLRLDQDAGIEHRYLDTTGARPTMVTIDPAGRVVVAATDRELLLWRVAPEPGERPGDGQVRYRTRYGVRDLRFTPAGTLVSLDQSGRLLRWNEDGTSAPAIDSSERFEAMALDPEGSRIALVSSDRTLWVGPLGEEAQPVGSLHGLSTPRLQWSPDGAWVSATTCDVRDCALDMVDADGSTQWGIDLHGRRARVRFSPDGSSMMVEHDYGVWVRPLGPDVSGEGRVVRLAVPAEHPRIAWSFAGETIRVVTSSSLRPGPADLSVWMIGRGSGAHEVLSMPNLTHWVASDDGQNILLQTEDQRTLLWRLSRDQMVPLLRPPKTVRSLSVSPDDQALLVYTDTDPRPALIDVASGEHRWLMPVTGVQAWSRDGTLAIGSMDIRLFSDPSPHDSVDFLAWLDAATSVTMEPEGFR